MTLATPPFGKILRGHVRNVPENAHVKFKVRSFNLLELLAFNCQIFRGSRDHGHALFWENFNRVIYELTLETRMSSLMSVALTVLELFAGTVSCYQSLLASKQAVSSLQAHYGLSRRN